MFRFFDRFLIKTIVSKTGELHFRRWQLLETKRGCLYLHEIRRSDADRDPHDHPWNFWSLILRGGYRETLITDVDGIQRYEFHTAQPGTLIKRRWYEFHQIRLLNENRPTWSLVWVGSRVNEPWGYLTPKGWVDHIAYRENKNAV